MENCDVKYGEITHSISIVNLRVSAIQALFQLDQEIIGLKDTLTGMIVLPNENGTFPNLDAYAHLQLNVGTHGQTVEEAKYPRTFQVTPAVLMMGILEGRVIGWLPTRRNEKRNLKGKRRTKRMVNGQYRQHQ